ncbi:MAG: amidohydrolase [Lachnospiraceae bacterium]|nr:amidohydrolase [Lachnospiraceae bacterium]
MNQSLQEWYDKNEDRVRALMHDIWKHPELGLKEHYSSRAAADFAKQEGFQVELCAAEDFNNPEAEPNTVIATWGNGKPVIGIVGELDALPNLGQESVPFHSPIEGPGHGCGHNLMAGGAMAAACALRYAMEKENLSGTVKLVEAPAEETGCGKSLLAENGVFSDMDMALMWHSGPGKLSFDPRPGQVAFRVKFEFFGKAAHAAGYPYKGRSALDAVQLMNMGCEFLREHTQRHVLIHYCITNGGVAPNVVPGYASSLYMFRADDDFDACNDACQRAIRVAQGAAIMTDTEMKYEIESVVPKFYLNVPLCGYAYEAAQKIPPLTYNEEDYEAAIALYKNLHPDEELPENRNELLPVEYIPYSYKPSDHCSCTDAADMSYYCPTMHYWGLGKVKDAAGHHWNTTYCASNGIGEKAGIYGYKILAQTGYDALTNPEIVEKCWEAYREQNIPPHPTFKEM